MNPNDEDPMQSIRPQNKADVEALISKHNRLLRTTAILMLVKSMSYEAASVEAEEVLQEVYKDIWEKGISGAHSLEAYLVRMVRNKVVDLLRRRRFHVELDETREDGRTDLEKEVEQNDLVEHVFSGTTPGNQQLIQRMAAGDSGKEIALSLGITVNTARSKVYRLRKKLRKILIGKDE